MRLAFVRSAFMSLICERLIPILGFCLRHSFQISVPCQIIVSCSGFNIVGG